VIIIFTDIGVRDQKSLETTALANMSGMPSVIVFCVKLRKCLLIILLNPDCTIACLENSKS
jgi:hypothetical protein